VEILEVVFRGIGFITMVWILCMRQRFLDSLEELFAGFDWAEVVSMRAFMCPSGSGVFENFVAEPAWGA
jgi:hypothetical protein